MGLIVCEKHGEQAMVHLCVHVNDAHLNDNLQNLSYYIKNDLSKIKFYFCNNCLKKYDLENKELMDVDDIALVGNDILPVCGKCFSEKIV